jgi:hypothetical protein
MNTQSVAVNDGSKMANRISAIVAAIAGVVCLAPAFPITARGLLAEIGKALNMEAAAS